ncbi:MAG TPA: hypothetical protein VMZ53_23900 [Kofleriaceae bacterium]|nr:hypothetical protein [Kofleriaceae bacterium]
MRTSILFVVSALALGACGGDDGAEHSGVSTSKQLKDLSADERMQECEWGVSYQGGAGHVTMCSDNVTVTVDTVPECVDAMDQYAASGCTATVAELEACTRAIAADPCSFGGDACGPVFACLGQ